MHARLLNQVYVWVSLGNAMEAKHSKVKCSVLEKRETEEMKDGGETTEGT